MDFPFPGLDLVECEGFLTFNSYQLKLHEYVLDPALFRYGVKIFKKAIYSLWNQVLLGSLVVAGVQLEYQVQGWPVVAGVQLEYQVQGMWLLESS